MAENNVDVSELMEKTCIDRIGLEQLVFNLCLESPEGVDFLVTSFVLALRSYRRPTVCAPFPLTLFNTGGALPDKDFSAAEDAVAHIPRMNSILAGGSPQTEVGEGYNEKEGSSPLSDMPIRALRLLQWIVSYRYSVRLVVEPRREVGDLFPDGKSPWCIPGNGLNVSATLMKQSEELRPQYVMELQAPVDGCPDRRREVFEAAKVKNGSFMAFHGTSAENIHCILRCGLLNMSGTRLQRNGAIFGEGIYFSTDPTVAITFCSAGEGWERSSFGPRARYLLLCEVANGPEVTRSHTNSSNPQLPSEGTDVKQPDLGTYVRVLNSDFVRVRYVFVYTEPSRRGLQQRDGSRVSRGLELGGGGQSEYGGTALRAESPRRIDWCKVIMITYAALLLGLGFFNSEVYRHARLPPFLHSFN